MSAPMFDKQKRPKVGVGVIVTNSEHPGCVLLGKRKGNIDGVGKYALPGGHLEFGESWEECARRETLEETALNLRDVQYYDVVNAVEVEKDYHYITIFMKAEVADPLQQPENLEPDKCESWAWVRWDQFPASTQLFCPLQIFRDLGRNPFQTEVSNHGS